LITSRVIDGECSVNDLVAMNAYILNRTNLAYDIKATTFLTSKKNEWSRTLVSCSISSPLVDETSLEHPSVTDISEASANGEDIVPGSLSRTAKKIRDYK
jgi:hypothetical protein